MSNVTPSSQIKVTLPDQLYAYLKTKADKFGLTMSFYVKNLIIDDVKDVEIPTFKMSEKIEKVGLEALEEHRGGNSTKIDNVSEFFENL